MKVHLDFYKKAMTHAYGTNPYSRLPELPVSGLCNCGCFGFINNSILHLFIPSKEELIALKADGKDDVYWGSGKPPNSRDTAISLTPLRQTILLFMAAINNEL